MNVLSIRDFPQDLLHRVKVQAAINGITMRQFVIGSLERVLKEKPNNARRRKKPRKQ